MLHFPNVKLWHWCMMWGLEVKYGFCPACQITLPIDIPFVDEFQEKVGLVSQPCACGPDCRQETFIDYK